MRYVCDGLLRFIEIIHEHRKEEEVMRRSEVCSWGKEVRDCQGGDDVQLHHLRWDQSPGFSTPVSLALSEGPMYIYQRALSIWRKKPRRIWKKRPKCVIHLQCGDDGPAMLQRGITEPWMETGSRRYLSMPWSFHWAHFQTLILAEGLCFFFL